MDRITRGRRAEELPHDFVEVTEVLRAELLEARGLEALVGDRRVAIELLFVRELLLRSDLVERRPFLVATHLLLRRRAIDRPTDVALHHPREVEVKRRH